MGMNVASHAGLVREPEVAARRTREANLPGGGRLIAGSLNNGVTFCVKHQSVPPGQCYTLFRSGSGVSGCRSGRLSPKWAVDAGALLRSGLTRGSFSEVEAVLAAKSCGMSMSLDDDGLAIIFQGGAAELGGQLGFTKLYYQEGLLNEAGIEGARRYYLNAMLHAKQDDWRAIYHQHIEQLVHRGDPRWAFAHKDYVQALSTEDIEKDVRPLMGRGPADVVVVGDVDGQAAVDLIEKTFGDLPARADPGCGKIEPSSTWGGDVRVALDDDRRFCALAAPAPNCTDRPELREMMHVLNRVFMNRLASRFAAEALERKPVAGSMELRSGLRDFGYRWVGMQIDVRQADVFRTLASEISAELPDAVDADEIEETRRRFREEERRRERSLSEAASACRGLIQKPLVFESMVAESPPPRVDDEQLRAAAQHWFSEQSYVMICSEAASRTYQ